jgi:hypothetical protein
MVNRVEQTLFHVASSDDRIQVTALQADPPWDLPIAHRSLVDNTRQWCRRMVFLREFQVWKKMPTDGAMNEPSKIST